MKLESLSLQHFRSYSKVHFRFDNQTTILVGPNTSGKSNIMEAIYLLCTGKSFRAQNDEELISFGHEFAKIQAETDQVPLEIIFSKQPEKSFLAKKFLVNGVAKRRDTFVGHLAGVLFTPSDLDLITGSPSLRRNYFDFVLDQIDREYRVASTNYTKALRARNRLLDLAKETGRKDQRQFAYWDEVLIRTGTVITTKREAFIGFITTTDKLIFSLRAEYDKSIISRERLAQYADAEVASGNTLVGPHRDDFKVFIDGKGYSNAQVRLFGSRGQQRLAVLQLKSLELTYMEYHLKEKPLLLLDDIFSELDEGHIDLVLSLVGEQQTILTTTHEEFIKTKFKKKIRVIELK